jgi:hypothetical protein
MAPIFFTVTRYRYTTVQFFFSYLLQLHNEPKSFQQLQLPLRNVQKRLSLHLYIKQHKMKKCKFRKNIYFCMAKKNCILGIINAPQMMFVASHKSLVPLKVDGNEK